MFEAVKEFIFPRKCLACGKWGSYLCPDCLNFIKTIDNPVCPICAKPSIYGMSHPGCLRKKPQSLNGLTSIFSYQGIVKKAISRLKYKFVTDLAETILELFLSYCGEDLAFTRFVREKNVVIIPVPLHKLKKNWRGFNQAELIGKMIAQKLAVGFMPETLIRTRNTKEQTGLRKKERRENIENAFKLNQFPSGVGHSLSIILFDDVWTTGATMRECAKVLKRRRIRQIWGLTLAR